MKSPTKAMPPGSKGPGVPGTASADRTKGVSKPAPTVVDPKAFGADHRGGPELKLGKSHFEVKDNRSRISR